jgi:hypothetical protein
MSKRTAVELCQELGLAIQTSGTGTAIFQLPPAGTRVPLGDLCSVTFALSKPPVANKPKGTSNSAMASTVRRAEAIKR